MWQKSVNRLWNFAVKHINKLLHLTNKWLGCANSGRGVNASIWIKGEMLKLKIGLSKNIAEACQCQPLKLVNINYISNKWLFQLKVGHEGHTKNYYREKLYKLSFYFRYLNQYQPSSELLLTKYRNQIRNEIFDSITKFPWTIYQLLQNNSPCREYAKPLEPFLIVSGFTF